jgi:hypothetical protein
MKTKTIILTAAFGLSLMVANAQKMSESAVPSVVKETFLKQYSGVKNAHWEKEHGNYEAEFEVNKVTTSVVIDPKGVLLETETTIDQSELPKKVQEYLAKNMAGKKIKEAAKITNSKGVVTYEAEVGKADYLFDANGEFIKKAQE